MNQDKQTKPLIDEMDLETVMADIERSERDNKTDAKYKTDYLYGALQAKYHILWDYCKNKIKDLPQ